MFGILAQFQEGSKEYEELMYRIICSIQYQQNEIDKSKGCISKSMKKEWYQYKANLPHEDDDEETLETKAFNQRILVDKKPYFFCYVYEGLGKDYKKYISDSNRKAMFQFGITLEELLLKESVGNLTEEEATFLHYYHLQMPVSHYPCVMNKICWKVEEAFKGYLPRQKKEVAFDYSVLKSNTPYSKAAYRRVADLYDLYLSIIERSKTLHKTFKKQSNEQHRLELNKIKINFKNEALKVCSNEEELCNMMLDFCYSKGKSKRFVWEILGEQIVENLKSKTDHFSFPVRDEAGDISFRGLTFKMIDKPLLIEKEENE